MEQIVDFYLIGESAEQDPLLQHIPTETRRHVLGSRTSVSGSEFAAAGAIGIRPDMRLTVASADYCGERIVEVDGSRYSVYRTYQPSVFKTELYLGERVGV